MNLAYGVALGNKAVAEDWMAYAKKLEKSLQETAVAVYRQEGIKNAALRELAKFDPNNPLFQQEVRRKIGDEAVEAAKKAGELK